MNKKSFDNLSFILLIGLIILFSLAIFALSLKPISLEMLRENVDKIYYSFYDSIINQLILGLIALLLFLFAIYLIQKRNRFSAQNLSITQKTLFGEVKISLSTIKHLISTLLLTIEEIKESKSTVNVLKAGDVNIFLHIVLKQDVNIPDISEIIQSKLKDYLFKVSGIEVKVIKIFIDKVFYEN